MKKETQNKPRKDNSKTLARKAHNVARYTKYQGKPVGVHQKRHLNKNRLKRLQAQIKDIGASTPHGKVISARIDELKAILHA